MAISLKEQLEQARQLAEVIYHAPKFDTKYYKAKHHSDGQKSGLRMFYDFYAMELLWSKLGAGVGSTKARERQKQAQIRIAKGEGSDDDYFYAHNDPKYAHISMWHPDSAVSNAVILPSKLEDTINSVYEQVTMATSTALIDYIRAATIQEFQYLNSQCYGWIQFRNSLVSHYNAKKTITKEEFNKIVKANIPQMAPYPETITRLLKFSRYYSKMSSDPADLADLMNTPKNAPEEPLAEPNPGEPEPVTPEEPDDTPDTPYTEPEFGKYGGKGQPASPYDQDWSGMSAFHDAGDLPEIPTDEPEEEEPKKPLNEEMINLGIMKGVYKAMLKAGVTLEDMEKGYRYGGWSGSFGGERWADGVAALIKLIDAKKNRGVEDMNHIIDHIYDLQHNTGSLLNKGPMFVSDNDLNRRYKINDLARFIPFVSPMIKNLILRFQHYYRPDQETADTEANMEKVLKTPKVPFVPEEVTRLTPLGFVPNGAEYQVGIKFKNKKGQSVSGVYYNISKRAAGNYDEKGTFQPTAGAPPIYIVSDNLMADVRVFKEFDKAMDYLMLHKKDMEKPYQSGYYHSPSAPVMSAHEQYVKSHTRIRLSMDKEQELLNLNLGWRKGSHKMFYRGYYKSGERLRFYAFSDGTFMSFLEEKMKHQVFAEWNSALQFAKSQYDLLSPYPDKAEKQSEIDGINAGTISPNEPLGSTGTTKYALSDEQLKELTTFIKTYLPHIPQKDFQLSLADNGMTLIVKKYFHAMKPILSVGKNISSSFGKPYKVKLANGYEKLFDGWVDVMGYLNGNFTTLFGEKLPSQTTEPSSITPSMYSNAPLPDLANSTAAYATHIGIAKPPTQSIRLTKEDETTLSSLGFEPKLVNGNVWYVHQKTSDTAKFFPNNTGKIIFTGMPSHISINLSIPETIAWLKANYTPDITSSPIKTGGKAPMSSTPLTGNSNFSNSNGQQGIQAPGAMFSGTIKEAGFTWDAATNQYFDVDNHNTLKIYKNRSSKLTLKGVASAQDVEKQFPNLASLVTYLKNEYPAQKKKSDVTQTDKEWPLAPGALTDALKARGYKFNGPAAKNAFIFDAPGARVLFHQNDGSSNVYPIDSAPNYFTFKNADELIEWLTHNEHNIPEWVGTKIFELLLKGKYQYSGAVYDKNITGNNYTNPNNEHVVLYPNGHSYVTDKNINEKFQSPAQLIEYLQEKVGFLPLPKPANKSNKEIVHDLTSLMAEDNLFVGNAQTLNINPSLKIDAIKKLRSYVYQVTGISAGLVSSKWAVENFPMFLAFINTHGIPNMHSQFASIDNIIPQWYSNMIANDKSELTDEDINTITQIVNSHPGFSISLKKSLSENEESVKNASTIFVYDKDNNEVFGIKKTHGKYELFSTIDGEFKLIAQAYDLNSLAAPLKTSLQNYMPNLPEFSNEQFEWVEAFVTNNADNVEVLRPHPDVIQVNHLPDHSALFMAVKAPKEPYRIRYYTYNPEHAEVKWDYRAFASFPELAAGIEKNLLTFINLSFHLNQLAAFPIEDLKTYLKSIGYVSHGEHTDKFGKEHEYYYGPNGSSIRIYPYGYCEYSKNDNHFKFHTYDGLHQYLTSLNLTPPTEDENDANFVPNDPASKQLNELGFAFNGKDKGFYEYMQTEYVTDGTILHRVQLFKNGMINYSQFKFGPEQLKKSSGDITSEKIFEGDYLLDSGLAMLKDKFGKEHIGLSGETYNTVAKDGILTITKLNEHDRKVMLNMGFTENLIGAGYVVYDTGDGVFSIVNDGTSTFKDDSGVHNFKTVLEGVKFVIPIMDKINIQNTERLIELGYVKSQTPHVPPPGQTLKFEWYREKSHEVLQVFATNEVRYGYVTEHSFITYATYVTLKNAVDYMYEASKDPLIGNQHGKTRAQADAQIEKDLVGVFGYKWDESSKRYLKGSNIIVFYTDGTVTLLNGKTSQDMGGHSYNNGYELLAALQTMKAMGLKEERHQNYKKMMSMLL